MFYHWQVAEKRLTVNSKSGSHIFFEWKLEAYAKA